MLFLFRTRVILGLYFPERQKYKKTSFERDQRYKNSQAFSLVPEKILHWAIQQCERRTLERFQGLSKCNILGCRLFLGLFYSYAFSSQIQLVTDFRGAEWSTRRNKTELHGCSEAWSQNPMVKVKVKYFWLGLSPYCLGFWFHLESFCIWCNTQLLQTFDASLSSTRKPPFFYSLHL